VTKQKLCEYCHKNPVRIEARPGSITSRTCSNSCAWSLGQVERYFDGDKSAYLAWLAKRNRERYANDPKVRERQKQYYKERRANDPEFRERRKQNHREHYTNDPEYRERLYRNNHARFEEMRTSDALSPDQWTQTLRVFKYKCVYCGDVWNHRDHFVPRKLGGKYVLGNVVPACARCNRTKHTTPPDQFCSPRLYKKIAKILQSLTA
jgi:5-methylcytosine-specific restriction endonuclease McrA